MKTIFYPAIFHPETTGYSVSVPDIEGCFTQGENMEDAISMAKEAINLMIKDEKVLPRPSLASEILPDSGDFITMIPFVSAEERIHFIPGDYITSIDDLMKCDRIYRLGRIYAFGFFCSWTTRYAMQEISARRLRKVDIVYENGK